MIEKVESDNWKKSKSYWRFVPSGKGKHDTENLLSLSDKDIEQEWDEAFISRFSNYPEEDYFLRKMSKEFSGKSILSIGSGFGLHEIYYQTHGANVTCYDIVETNLLAIERICRIKKISPIKTIYQPTEKINNNFGLTKYDVIFVYGSLMTMSEAKQKELIQELLPALHDNGSLLFMLYTWDFVKQTCMIESVDQYETNTFAHKSDPSVGGEHCPWSDWHDEYKLLALFERPAYIYRSTTWNQNQYVWYEVKLGQQLDKANKFFDVEDMYSSYQEISLLDIQSIEVFSETSITNQYTHKLIISHSGFMDYFARLAIPSNLIKCANVVFLELDLREGAFAVGIYDEVKNSFTSSKILHSHGKQTVVLNFDDNPSGDQFLIFSNFNENQPANAVIELYAIKALHKPKLSLSKEV